jgi:hypothetical protein
VAGSTHMRSAFAPLARALVATAGRAALQRALPLYLGLGIAAAIVFEGNGMRPATLTREADVHPMFRVALWGVWLLVSTPAARAILCTPSSFFLRALPVSRPRFFAIQGAMLGVAELPWLWLWTRGAGPLRGAVACMTAGAAHGILVSRPTEPVELALAATLCASVVFGAPVRLLAPLALGAGVFALRAAWVRAPEQPRRRDLPLVFGRAPVALAPAHLASVYRRHGALAVRALFFTTMAIAVTVLTARNDRVLDPGALATLSLTILAPAATLALAGLSGPVLQEEQQARWIFDTCGTSPRVRIGAAAGAVAAAGALLGALHGTVTAAFLRVGRIAGARLVLDGALVAAALGVIAMQTVRWSARGDGRDPARTVVLLVGVLVAAVVLVRGAEEWASMALCVAAGLSTLREGPSRTPGMGAFRRPKKNR